MSNDMLNVIEVLAESETSWEDAADQAIAEATRRVHGIKSLDIKDVEAMVEDTRLTTYRINAKITFELD